MLDGLARLAARRPRRFLVATAVFVVVAGALGGPVIGLMSSSSRDFEDPGADSRKARNQLERATGANPDIAIVALIRPGMPVDSAGGRAAIQAVVAKLQQDPAVARIFTVLNSHNKGFVSRDGTATYVVASFKPLSEKKENDAAKRIKNAFKGQPQVSLGGPAIASEQVNTQVGTDLARAEQFGFPILFLLSLFFFRGLVAALLPLAAGIVSTIGTLLLMRIANSVVLLSVYSVNLIVGLGLGLSIDYSLFMVWRFREEIARTGSREEALRRTMATAGRTVLFSACTVAAAVASLMVFPERFLYSMGLGGLFLALVSAATALVFLPALLFALGPRVNSLSPARWRRSAEATAAGGQQGPWYSFAQLVMRRAVFVAVGAAALLVALGIPFLHVKFIGSDARELPKSASARQVQDAVTRDFSRNQTSPIYLSIRAPQSAGQQLTAYSDKLRTLPSVLVVAPPKRVGAATWQIDVYSKELALADATQRLVKDIRAMSTPFPTMVGGEAPVFRDQEASFSSYLPIALGIVAVTTLVLLFLLTGSLILPIKTLIMNLLSLSATLGFLVLIFQDGRFQGLLGYTSPGALNVTQPIFIGAVAFALSTDYAVFLLTRIKEARDHGAGETEAVAIGIERTGRIVTAAAAMLAIAVGAFVTSKILVIKELGLGIAFAVLLDATIVRALFVPSLMKMLGAWNWWAPEPLRRLHERIGLRESVEPLTPASRPAGR